MTAGAVIAHFDPTGERSSNWRAILETIRPLVSCGVIVTTGSTQEDIELAKSLGYSVIRRRNIGYDFMSYAVGFDAVRAAHRVSRLLFCNDSFYVSRRDRFSATLEDLVKSEDAIKFATISNQIYRHGQSYLFALDESIFNRSDFVSFFSSIRPEATRLNVIFRYELGLSGRLVNMGAPLSAIIEGKAKRHITDRRGLNPTHDLAERIEMQLGYVKYERLLRNPLALRDGDWLTHISLRAKEQRRDSPMVVETAKPSCVIICHCHYPEVIDEMLEFFDRFPDGTEIHVTSSNPDVLTAFKTRWRRRNILLSIVTTENRGRDVAPFFKTLRLLDVADNTPILKIHGKRSLYSPSGEKWRKDMLMSLAPTETSIVQIIGEFATNQNLGMLGPTGSYVSSPDYWGANDQRVFEMMRAAGVPSGNRDDLGFFAGTMFWIRSQCARIVADIIDDGSFDEEAGQRDGTYAHAIERAIPMILTAKGWEMREIGCVTPMRPDLARVRRLEYL